VRLAFSVLITVTAIGSTGCTMHADGMSYRGQLDQRFELELEHGIDTNLLFLPGARTDLQISASGIDPNSGDWYYHGAAIGKFSKWRKWPYDIASLEGRADAERKHVWVVDRKAARVIASLDLETDKGTGPFDPAPEWATVNGGTVLERLDGPLPQKTSAGG
jgi:hypothetical protein